MDNEIKLSDAMRVLKDLWRGVHSVNPYSEVRIKSVMYDGMKNVIEGGLHFDKEDFSKLSENFHIGSGYYYTTILGINDFDYTAAIIAENISACQSFEYATKRKPFITNNVEFPYHENVAGHLNHGGFSRSRLGINATFQWNNEEVTVTSFNDKEGYLVACTYKPRERTPVCQTCHMSGGYFKGSLKIDHLYKITNKELKDADKKATP